jgi:hypothetical protein
LRVRGEVDEPCKNLERGRESSRQCRGNASTTPPHTPTSPCGMSSAGLGGAGYDRLVLRASALCPNWKMRQGVWPAKCHITSVVLPGASFRENADVAPPTDGRMSRCRLRCRRCLLRRSSASRPTVAWYSIPSLSQGHQQQQQRSFEFDAPFDPPHFPLLLTL